MLMLVLTFSLIVFLAIAWSSQPDTFQQVVWRCWVPFRVILGWVCLVVGVLGLILPILPGIPFLVAGSALVGRRDPLLRRAIFALKRRLRCWAQQQGVRRLAGRYGLRVTGAIGRQMRLIWVKRSL